MPHPTWLLPTPGGPKIKMLAPFSSHESPLANAITWAFDSIGTSANSKLLSVLLVRRQFESILDSRQLKHGRASREPRPMSIDSQGP
jgi:hypothetical protein